MAFNVLDLHQWQKYIRTVCARAGLTLEWSDEGVNATDGKKIWVMRPSWPMSESVAALTQSIVIHESSHVQHSDFEAGQRINKQAPATFSIWNVIEDDRIEYLPSKEWEGDRRAFIRTAPAMTEKFVQSRTDGIAKMHAEGADPAKTSLQEKLFAVGIWNCHERAATWAPAYDVPKNTGNATVQGYVAKLHADPECKRRLDAARPVKTLDGSRAMINLAEYIAKLLDVTPQEQAAAKAMQQAGAMGQQGAGADDGQHEGMAKEIGEGEAGAAKADAQKHAEANPGPADDDKGDPQELSKVKRGKGTYEPVDPDDYLIQDARDMECGTRRGGLHREVERLSAGATGLDGLTSTVRRLLQIASQTLRTYGHKSGRLHGAALHRISANVPGYSERVFRRQETQLDLDAAVFVLVDSSGSMGSCGKMANAIIGAEKLATCIGNVLGVPTKVALFSTGSDSMWEEQPKMLVAREFNERMVHPDKLIDRMCTAATNLGANNNDAESVIWAISELRAQRAKRKFLIVLSDGMPCCARSGDAHTYLKETIKAASALPGMEVHGIGIMSGAVEEFYPNHSVLNDPSEIGACVVKLIAARMLNS